MTRRRAGPVRGVGLVEVLVAVAVAGIGLASLMALHTRLRAQADLSRMRAEAVRLAAQDLERLRWHDGAGDGGALRWEDIGPLAPTGIPPHPAEGAMARPTLERSVRTDPRQGLRSLVTRIRWSDRHGDAHTVALATAIAALDPSLGGVALLDRRTPARMPAAAAERAASLRLPPGSRDLGGGRVAFRPRADASLVWVLDRATAQVTSRCDVPTDQPLERLEDTAAGACRALTGLLLSGHIRYATRADTVTAADAEQPDSPALGLTLRLTLTGGPYPTPAWECAHDGPVTTPAPTPPGVAPPIRIAYHCVIQPMTPASGGPPRWSGRLDLVPAGWLLASGTATAGRHRVCRYSADHDGNGRIDNPEHPASHVQVTGPLGAQDFLVIRAAARCPLDTGPFLPGGNPVDDSTAPHQP